MALQTSGEISILDIYNEFGGPSSGGYGLSDYYRGGSYVGNNNTNVPTSGEIALSDFYGASAGVEVQYSVTGGGGAGGYGVDNGSVANSFANAGGASSINHTSFTAISAAGGAGGQNGSSAQGTGSGGNGADSALGTNTGGAGGGRNSSGGAGNRGGGGGGGGGDAPSRYDRSGAAGSGGGAGATETGSLFLAPGITIDMVVGSGGLRSTTGYDGGSGGAGEITISQQSINPADGTTSFNIIRTFGGADQRAGQSGSQFVFNQPKAADLSSQFWPISEFVNRTNEADTNNPYSVSEIMNLYSGTGRLYITHKSDYSSSTFYNDVPIACVQIINGLNNSVVQNWWFGDTNQSWETADGYIAGTSTNGTAYTPAQAAGRSYFSIGTGYDSTRFMLASSTSSSRTGAQGGISNPGTSPMAVGEETVSQASAENYIFRETSSTNPRYSQNHCRSPSRTWQVGEFVRIAYIVGNNSTGTYDADDILHIAIA
jgi:hypothetical protein